MLGGQARISAARIKSQRRSDKVHMKRKKLEEVLWRGAIFDWIFVDVIWYSDFFGPYPND